MWKPSITSSRRWFSTSERIVSTPVVRPGTSSLTISTEYSVSPEYTGFRKRLPCARKPLSDSSTMCGNIPAPADGPSVTPDVLLVPLVGFDAGGYRLGYGGGYYDRSLAARTPRPLAIGIGFEISRLATIHPQPHDIPMDAIVTERGMLRIRVQEGTP